MKFHVVMQWPSSDILPQVEEAGTATDALKACMALMRRGCQIKSICRIDASGATLVLLPRELVTLARQEGYRVKFPPRIRRTRQTLSSILLAIMASMLPNSFGDFCTLLDFGTYRVAIRREEGARRPSRRAGRIAEAPPPDEGAS
jgi:hypothetical protein